MITLTCGNSNKHSSYSSSFPIYLYTTRTEEVPDEDAAEPVSETPEESTSKAEPTEAAETLVEKDEDEAVVEDVPSDEDKKPEEPPAPKMKSIRINEWSQLNAQPPLWTRSVKINFWHMPFIKYRFQ